MNDRNNIISLGESYEKWRKRPLGRITDALEQRLLLELIGDVRGRSVLDVGCGDGALAVALWQRNGDVFGMDAALPMTQAARQRAAREEADIALAVATAEAMPYASERFDCAVAVTMLCFAADAEEAVHEMARVLRPGGRLVIGELGRWSLWAGSRRLRGWLGHPVWRRARFRTADELRDLVVRAGLRVEDLRGAIFYPPCGAAARLSSGIDRPLGRLTTVGAAFLALLAVKPAAR